MLFRAVTIANIRFIINIVNPDDESIHQDYGDLPGGTEVEVWGISKKKEHYGDEYHPAFIIYHSSLNHFVTVDCDMVRPI